MTKRQALVIGINQYPFGDNLNLSTAADDADKIAQLLERFGDFEVHRLPCKEGVRKVDSDKNLILEELEDAITQLFQPKSDIIPETALLFFAGHGWRSEKDGQPEGFLVTSDARFEHDSEDGLFSLKSLHKILKDSPVRQQIVWLDCCHSGELFNFTETNLGEEIRGRDRCLIVASREFETAIGGVLTPALLAGLNPENNSDGWVTNYTLKDFIDEKLNAEKPQQHHRCSNPNGIIHLTGKNGVLANIRPYRGLKYFDFNPEQLKACDDHKYFYGRTNLTKKLLQKLRESNFIAVLGVSGTGKSSLVRAGLLYQLYLGDEIAGSDSWKLYPSFRPGKHPLESLKNVIGAEADQLEAVVKIASADRVVLVIDQFEEIFTECKDDAERRKFFNYLLRAVEGLGNKLCLVLVMRSDFENRFHQPEYEKLGRKISQKQNLLRVEQMTNIELREAIIEPAKKVQIEVETELVTSLIQQVENSPGYLPLLQFTLDKLWQQSQKKRLINSDLTKLGGVAGALEQHANQIYDSFLQDEDKNLLSNQQGLATQEVAKWIFVALTRLNVEGVDTRRQVRKEDLLTDKSPEAEELLEQVIKRLADANLIVTSNLEIENKKIPVVDIAHEALIRYWPRLYSWLHENREALLIRQDIEDAAQTWRDQDKNNRHQLSHSKQNKFIAPFIHYFSLLAGENRSYLLSGKELKQAANFIKKKDIKLSKVAEDFVNLSLQREKCLRTVSILSFSILGLLATAWYCQSRVSFSQNLVKKAKDLREQPAEFQTSMLLAIEAVRIHESLETTQNLWNGLTLLPQNIQDITNTSPKNDNNIELSKTKKYQVTTLENNHIMLKAWNNSQKKYEKIYPYQPFGYITDVSCKFSPNDHYLATGYGKYGGYSEVLSDMTNHTKAETENVKLGGEDNFNKIAFSYNNKYISTVNHDNKIELWDANSRKKIWEEPSPTQLNNMAFSPGDKYLAVTDSSQIRLLEIRTKKIKIIDWQNSNTGKIVFSPEGKYLFGTSHLDKSAYGDSSVFVSQIWDVETGDEVARFTDKAQIQKVTYSSNGKFLNIEYGNGTVKQWEPAKKWILSLRTQDDILSLNFSDDGKYLVAIGQTNGDVSADIWDVNSHEKIKNFGLASNSSPRRTGVYAVLFSNDFKYLFVSLDVGGMDSPIKRLYEIKTGKVTFFSDDGLPLSSGRTHLNLMLTEYGILESNY